MFDIINRFFSGTQETNIAKNKVDQKHAEMSTIFSVIRRHNALFAET